MGLKAQKHIELQVKWEIWMVDKNCLLDDDVYKRRYTG
jgi:hypothetical protein